MVNPLAFKFSRSLLLIKIIPSKCAAESDFSISESALSKSSNTGSNDTITPSLAVENNSIRSLLVRFLKFSNSAKRRRFLSFSFSKLDFNSSTGSISAIVSSGVVSFSAVNNSSSTTSFSYLFFLLINENI